MELILLKDVEKLGRKGDVVRVKDGFARNFLLPRKAALPCTRENREFAEAQNAKSQKRREKEKTLAHTDAERLGRLKVIIEAKAGEKGKLFGSVTAEDISEALSREGHAVTKKQIHLAEPIHALGTYQVSVELYPEVKAAVTVEVIRQPS